MQKINLNKDGLALPLERGQKSRRIVPTLYSQKTNHTALVTGAHTPQGQREMAKHEQEAADLAARELKIEQWRKSDLVARYAQEAGADAGGARPL